MLNIRGHIWIACLFLIPAGSVAQSLQLADSLRVKGEKFQERGNFKEAEFYYEEAFNLFKTHRDTASWLMTGVYYAETLSYQSEMNEAITLLKDLKSIPHPANNDSLKARIESDLGWIYKQMEDLSKSLAHFRKGLTYAERSNYILLRGIILNNLASTYQKQDDTQKALKYYKKALPIFEDLDNKRSRAYALSNIGNIYRKLHLFDKALEYYSRSLQITKQLENVNLQAYVHDNMGKLQKDLGNYDQALIEMQKSLNYRRQANNLQEVASTLNTIGTLYLELGDTPKAIEYYQQSLSLWQKVSNPHQLAVAHANIASGLWGLGQQKNAITHYRKALALNQKNGAPRFIATSFLDLVKVYHASGENEKAYSYVEKAQRIAESSSDRELLMRTALWSGTLKEASGHTSNAIKDYHKALAHSHSLSKNAQITPLKRLAFAHNKINSDSAVHYGQQAIGLVEEGRSQVGPISDFKAGYFKKHSDFYIDLASWAIKYENSISSAYHLVESAKARALTDELSQAARRIDESLPEEKRLQRAQRLSKISRLYSRMSTPSDSTNEKDLKAQVRDEELAYAAFENKLQQQYPQYKLLESPEPIALQKVQEMCDTETAIMEYAISGNQLLAFYITNDSVEANQMAIGVQDSSISEETLANRIMQFREAIIDRAPIDSIRSLSQPIYQKLIAPFQDKLANKKNIIIVPDGVLAYLPFEALSVNNNYLVSEYNIKYTPSITSFSLLSPPGEYKNDSILTIANASRNRGAANAPVLPTAKLEVESIAQLFRNATILRDQQINENNVKAHLQNTHSIVHIAAHSVIDEQNPSMSGIILGKNESETGLSNDGYLRNSEIYRMNIPSSMVVLSACKSAMGQMVNGEGLLGLQRAFFNAGTSTVVVSLWDVYDRPTTHFMQLFYKSLTSSSTQRTWGDTWQSMMRWAGWDTSNPYGFTAPSMRKAKLSMLNHPKYNHPVYWAPFVTVGR